MDPLFSTSPSGHLVSTVNGAKAFIPRPLPPKIDGGVHLTAIAEASAALGELNGSARRLSNPALLLRPLQSREALTSSAIEGTYSTEEDLALLEADASTPFRNDAREVQNYAFALRESLASIAAGVPITQALIKAVHRRLLSGLPSNSPSVRPGEYKIEQNFIGGKQSI